MCVCVCVFSCVRLFTTHGLRPTKLLCLWDFPRKSTGVSCPFAPPGDLPYPRTEPD